MTQLTNSHKYDDIIHLSHPESVKHPRMARKDRAAQFSPFAALTGYNAAISETERLTEVKRELDENIKSQLDERIAVLKMQLEERPVVQITFFKADERKRGGTYITVEGIVQKIKEYEKVLQMEDETQIPIADIYKIDGSIFSAD